jgi:cell division protein FtsI (penicillin-binding protein 3)
VSSNTGIVKIINDHYKSNPSKFVDGLYAMHLKDSLALPIVGEGQSIIPDPRIKNDRWSGIALQWMAYGYGVSFTPLQTLTFYNAIANNGTMVRPRFVKEIKAFDQTVEVFDTEVINPQICSKETISTLQKLLQNVVEKEHGTGHGLYSSNFSMAGKTGTCQKDYTDKEKLNYISSFVGYFPADQPKYSCIVVIHEPDKSVGYYGADVSGPVFKKIAQKIYTDSPVIDYVEQIDQLESVESKNYSSYYQIAQSNDVIMPNLKGLPAMDALSILENMGMKVQLVGNGSVRKQSIKSGVKLKENALIVLELS